MSETQVVVPVVRPLHAVAQDPALPATHRPDRAPLPVPRPTRVEQAGEDGSVPTAGADPALRGRAAHCRIAMQYVD
ncbi:hypothetical protein OG401_39480 [Kitasatospora purpeofusca]|uniref:hypothetical protein n=1 Tax=Kitasatospora purpeofusca TaxID=67352 RepID=UPI000AB029E6|nr:hypothetical protein [Kitasatospora purpeofusca]MCX4690304.1 hypothetical protein [Kitasatospora purpeofusca]